MLHRSIAVRLVLVVAALTTVATSAPEDVLLSDTTEGTLPPGETQISVFGNRAAINNTNRVLLEFRAAGVPDLGLTGLRPDPALPAPLDEIRQSAIELEYDVGALCMLDSDCETTITVAVPPGEPVDVDLTASFAREGDGALLFPDDRSFPDDATIEVRIGP